MDASTYRVDRGEPKASTSSTCWSNVPPGGEEEQQPHILHISQLNRHILEQPKNTFCSGVQHRRAGERSRASSSARPRQGSGGWRGYARPLQVPPKRSFKCFALLLPLRIVGSNYGLFGVSEDSGKLELTASPDREQRDMYILRVKVAFAFSLTSVRLFLSLIVAWFQGRGERNTLTIA